MMLHLTCWLSTGRFPNKIPSLWKAAPYNTTFLKRCRMLSGSCCMMRCSFSGDFMTELHLIIARDMQENIMVYQPFCNNRPAEENVLEHIVPMSVVPLQELLSEKDVLTTFGIDHEWMVAKI